MMLKITFLFVAIQVVGSSSKTIENPENAAALRTIANDGLEFSKRFYEVTAKAANGNFISSPISVSSTLFMLAYGARSQTQSDLKAGLYFKNDDNVQGKGLKALIEEINNSPGVELILANKIFLDNTMKVKPEYQKLGEEIFKTTVQQVDFSKLDNASKTINDWCKKQTNSKIKDVVSPSSIEPDTLAVLVNTVYFKGKWQTPFSKEATDNDIFHLEDGTTKNVSSMYTRQTYNYGVLPDVKSRFVELPYQGGEISMFIILPDEVNGLKNLQQNFAKLNFSRLLTEGKKAKLDLSFPKFEIETEINLRQPIIDLGMGKIFEDSADFSGMVDKAAKIGKAIQKAYIKVDEEGTEAAAVSGHCVIARNRPRIAEFYVDRPFYYAIIKRVENTPDGSIVLFQGHYKGDD